MRKRLFTILKGLEAYSLRHGEAPHELIRVFGADADCSQVQLDSLSQKYDSGEMAANFENAVRVAQVFAGRGEMECGWKVLWDHMSLWWPVDKAQVAPVIFLTDTHLCLLMDQEKCEQVLALPRGPEAAKIIASV